MSLEDIQQVIYQQHITNFMQCRGKYEEDTKLCLQNANLKIENIPFSFPEYKPVGIPSMEMILASLLNNFPERRIYYHQRMSELSARILLMGHFYKVSQQMGTMGIDGKGWVPKYDFVYAIMNENGQVIAWQVTRGTNAEDVRTLVENVHQRLTSQHVNVEMILTPDCCHQKEWLNSIFGTDVVIKMDPYFAIQKLEKRFKIRKGDHDHVQTCLQDYNLVFHKATDLESDRKEETPSPDVIQKNLDSFISQWKNVKGDTNERLLHDPALRELESLKPCVSNGCLSGIPPQSGAKFVKDLRSYIYPVLHRRFLNADLAIPVLTTLFYCWNERHSGKFDGEFIPITAYKAAVDAATISPTTEQFGCLEDNLHDKTDESENCESSLTQYLHLLQSLMFHILFAINQEGSSNTMPLTEPNMHNLDYATLNEAALLADNYHLVLQNLKCLTTDDVPVNLWHYHVLPCCTLLFSRCDCPVEGEDKASVDLKMKKNLEMFGGTLLSEENDLDGFFVALALGLNAMMSSLEEENSADLAQFKEHLSSVGYDVDDLKDDVRNTGVTVLRQIICDEWKKNKQKYSKLLTSPLLDFDAEAEIFVHQNYSRAEMVNILPIATVQVFKIPLIIFTSMEKFPVVPVVPADKLVTSQCLYMAYSLAGFGSYYPVTVFPSKKPSDKPKYVCRCGLGNSKNKQERGFCVHVPGRYLTRCECFRNGVACNHLCRCFNCANPQGTSKESRALHTCQKTRLRSRHKLQQMRRNPSSLDYKDMKSPWSEQECLTFQFLIDAMKFSDIYPSFIDTTAERILEEYRNLQQHSQNTKLMKEKTLDDIKIHLKIFSKSLETFQALYKKQSEENWDSVGVNPTDVEMSDGNQLVVIVESSE